MLVIVVLLLFDALVEIPVIIQRKQGAELAVFSGIVCIGLILGTLLMFGVKLPYIGTILDRIVEHIR